MFLYYEGVKIVSVQKNEILTKNTREELQAEPKEDSDYLS